MILTYFLDIELSALFSALMNISKFFFCVINEQGLYYSLYLVQYFLSTTHQIWTLDSDI